MSVALYEYGSKDSGRPCDTVPTAYMQADLAWPCLRVYYGELKIVIILNTGRCQGKNGELCVTADLVTRTAGILIQSVTSVTLHYVRI